jgi:hypothetical protein
MKTSGKILLLATILGMNSYLYAGTVYSNLGPGGSFTSENGWSIGYPFGPGECGQSIAFSFTPSNNFYLSSVDLAIANGSPTGSSEFLVAIYSDLSGAPDKILETASGIAPITASVGTAPEETSNIAFLGSTLLSSGSKYWLGLHPTSAQPTDLGWWWNIETTNLQSTAWQSNTPLQVLLGGTWEKTYVLVEAAYQVNGIVVPEPTTVCILGIGALSLLRRKK